MLDIKLKKRSKRKKIKPEDRPEPLVKECTYCNEPAPHFMQWNKRDNKFRPQNVCQDCYNIKYGEIAAKRSSKAHTEFKGKCVMYADPEGKGCKACGLKTNCYAVYTFHHLDPEQKDFDGSEMKSKPWEVVTAELDKCDMYCRNCHAMLHAAKYNDCCRREL